jgi:outer membrane protein assembly factor BamB
MPRTDQPLYIGTNRHVAALDVATGEEVWRTRLPKCNTDGPVSMLIKDAVLIAASSGQVWCLDKRDGTVLWHNGLPGLGYNSVQLMLEGAQAATSQDSLAGAIDKRRRDAAAAAANT